MDMFVYCHAMAAFCRQRAMFEDENSEFWIAEADEWDKLILHYASEPAADSIWSNDFGGASPADVEARATILPSINSGIAAISACLEEGAAP